MEKNILIFPKKMSWKEITAENYLKNGIGEVEEQEIVSAWSIKGQQFPVCLYKFLSDTTLNGIYKSISEIPYDNEVYIENKIKPTCCQKIKIGKGEGVFIAVNSLQNNTLNIIELYFQIKKTLYKFLFITVSDNEINSYDDVKNFSTVKDIQEIIEYIIENENKL